MQNVLQYYCDTYLEKSIVISIAIPCQPGIIAVSIGIHFASIVNNLESCGCDDSHILKRVFQRNARNVREAVNATNVIIASSSQ